MMSLILRLYPLPAQHLESKLESLGKTLIEMTVKIWVLIAGSPAIISGVR